MVKRIKLLTDVFMPIEGQWCLVAAGAVIDAPDSMGTSDSNIQIISPGEAAGSLKNAAHARPIRNLRIK